MGSQLRTGDVTTATDSITQYARYSELRGNGQLDAAAAVLEDIEDYNHYDCRSTRELRDWLLMRAFESGVTPLGAQPVSDGGSIEEADALAVTLQKFSGVAASPDRTPEQTAVALVSAARGYHRREDKPFWWAHFDRLNYPVDEWSDETDVFMVDQAKVSVDWHKPPRAQKLQRRLQLTGELARGALSPGADVYALYDPPAPSGLTDNPDRRAAGRATVMEVNDPERADRGGRVRTNSGRRQHVSPDSARPDARRADRDQAATRGHRSGGGRCGGGPAATPPHRGGRHPAPPPAPDPQRRGPSQKRRRRRRHHLRPAGSGFVVRRGARTARYRQDLHRRTRHHPAGRRPRLARRRGRPVARGGGKPARLCDRSRHRPAAGRQEEVRPPQRPVAADQRERVRRIHQRHTRMRDRRDGLGLRQPRPGCAGSAGPAGDRRGGPVLPGQHDRGRRVGRQPAAARRPAAAARRSARALIPSRSTGPRWAGWSKTTAPCPPSAATFWTAPIACIRRCVRRCRRWPTRAGCSRTAK